MDKGKLPLFCGNGEWVINIDGPATYLVEATSVTC